MLHEVADLHAAHDLFSDVSSTTVFFFRNAMYGGVHDHLPKSFELTMKSMQCLVLNTDVETFKKVSFVGEKLKIEKFEA